MGVKKNMVSLDDLFEIFVEFAKKIDNNAINEILHWIEIQDEVSDDLKLYFIKTVFPLLESEIRIAENKVKMKYEMTE